MNFRFLHFTLTGLFASLLLSGCGTLGSKDSNEVDCKSVQSSCHSGRFGLVYKTKTANGEEGDSVSGTYVWRSGRYGEANSRDVAYLEVNSTLGPNLGVAKRFGDFYEVRAADGRVYLAKDWQSLFDLMFPVKLPADSLIKWMVSPQTSTPPALPPNWEWQVTGGKYRLVFAEGNATGRIDLIPLVIE